MAIAGIEGLAQGLIQGMALKRQNDRQDVLDAQNLEKFGMDKERFKTQQAASAFELQNAQTNAANAAIDRTRALGIQKKGDDFEANLGKIYGAGTPEGELIELEKIHQGSGVKGAWARDPKTGGLAKSADGKFRWVNEDGTAYDASVEDAVGAYIGKVDPKGEYARRVKNRDELAKEAREAKIDAAKAAKQHEYRIGEIKTTGEQSRIEKIENPNKPLSLSDIKIAFSETYETGQKNADGTSKLAERVDQKSLQTFAKWLKANKKKATNQSYFDWKAENSDGSESATTSGTDTYDSTSQGKLVAKGLAPEVDAVDMSGRSKLGGQGAAQPVSGAPKGLTVNPSAASNQQSATPTEESIAKPVTKTQVVSKRQGRGGQMSAPKTIIYQEIQGKFGDPIPDGFKRKKAPFGTDVRTPEYNVFVSKNYDEYND